MAARELRDRIEEVPGVLEAALQGARDDLVEVIIDPVQLSSYGLQLEQLIQAVGASNSLVAAGTSGGLGGPLRGQGAVADRDTPRTSPTCRSSPARMRWCGPATSPPSVRPSRTPRRSPGWTASRRSPSRSRSAPAPTWSRRVDQVKAGRRRRSSSDCPRARSSPTRQDKSTFDPPAARRSAEPCDDRRHPGVHRHPLRAVRAAPRC